MALPSELLLDGFTLDPLSAARWALLFENPSAKPKLRISTEARARIQSAEAFVAEVAGGSKPVYGINTGFGKFAEVAIAAKDLSQLQYNLIRSHAAGVGQPLARSIVALQWIYRLNTFCRGRSGVRWSTVEAIIRLLDAGVLAEVPECGSVGASGDLAPSAHASLTLLGEGLASGFESGKLVTRDALSWLKALSLEPVRLGPKEGLALINGTQLSSATLSLALLRAKSLIEHANLACAMTLEGVRGSDAVFDQRIFVERNHPEASQMSEQIRGWLGTTSPIRESHKNCGKVQDPYSLRCAGQVHGAVWADYQNALRAVRNEINSSTDNPLLFAEEKLSLSGGNFHAMFVARASDSLAAGLSVLASISERRTALMMHQESSGHPFFLTRNGGLNSGFMMAQVSAAALVAEAKVLSYPASVDSIPTSADREDHVSMGPISGRKAMRVAELVEGVIAIELLCAAQAIDLLRPLKSSERIEEAHLRIRRDVAELQEDRVLSTDILKVQRLIQLSDLMEEPS